MPWMYALNEDGIPISYKGDSGPMCDGYYLDENGAVCVENGVIPRVGLSIRVGSITSRSFSSQDWWQTTPITKILEDKTIDGRREIKFKTRNSIYLWKE